MDRIEEILTEELTALRDEISRNIEAAGERASGRTQESLRVEASNDGGTLYGRQAFGTTETGRKAGAVPHNIVEIIRQWIQDKGIKTAAIPYKTDRPHKYTPAERGEIAAAAAIAYSIKERGTRLYRDGGRTDIYSDAIPAAVERIKARIGALFVNEIKSIRR